ncbi:hypothetical protein GWN42_31305 [candidate division KSB1 bacterium]|nr:hypothetical protein [Phycisphaerae bacterium]NIQ92547.1 hypothetical protein [Deltaproteobacteria bacterium]NIV97157.1 hypothetical protein [candidate division KSB1 bacterium]
MMMNGKKSEKRCVSCGQYIKDRHHTAKKCWDCYNAVHYGKKSKQKGEGEDEKQAGGANQA